MVELTPSSVDGIWTEIGFTDEEKSTQIENLKAELERIKENFTQETEQRLEALTSTIDQIKEKHISELRVVGAPESEIEQVQQSGLEGDLPTRESEVQARYDAFYTKIYQPRVIEFETLKGQIQRLSDRLGQEIEAEFAEIGTEDLSLDRLSKFRGHARQLEAKLTESVMRFSEVEEEIARLARDLQEDNPPDVAQILLQQDVSESAFQTLDNYLDDLKELFETRRRQIAEMAVEITKLWDLLKVEEYERNQFMASHTVLSQANVEDCIAEAERLMALRSTQLPRLVQLMRRDIRHIASDLSYTEEQLEEIEKECSKPENEEDRFTKTEAELLKLKKLHIAATPILDLVKQRDEIYREYERCHPTTEPAEATDDGKKRSSRPRPPEVADRGRIDRIDRRYKIVLPRVEGKLKVLLEQFREEGGIDFTWKGKILIDELKDVPVPATTRVRTTTGTPGSSSKRSKKDASVATWTGRGQKPSSPPRQKRNISTRQ
jgi:hypothetical protein